MASMSSWPPTVSPCATPALPTIGARDRRCRRESSWRHQLKPVDAHQIDQRQLQLIDQLHELRMICPLKSW